LENKINEKKELKFLENIEIFEASGIRPIKDYYFRNFDLDSKLDNLSQESYFLYKNILKDEMGTDIYYLPTGQEKDDMSSIFDDMIYRYKIKDDFLNEEIEENYRKKELENLDEEDLSETNNTNFNFFEGLNTLFFKIEENKFLENSKKLKFKELYYNDNLKKNINNFFNNYHYNINLYNNGEFYAYNEYYIYENYKELDKEILNIFNDPFYNFERDLSKRENYNFNRLYKAISETTLMSTEEASLQEYDFTEIKRYQDDEDSQIFYNQGEHDIEKQKVINNKILEDSEELLSLEATKIKFNKVKSKHLYRFYKDNKINYITSDHDKKILLKADDFFY
jgi:hypothetical protein